MPILDSCLFGFIERRVFFIKDMDWLINLYHFSVKVYIFACSEFYNFIKVRHESTAWLKNLKVIHTQPTQKPN